MSATRVWTVDEVRELPEDGKRYEVIDGELFVTPAPTRVHQRAVRELMFRLGGYLREHGKLEVLGSPADISYGRHALVQPDVLVIPRAGGPASDRWTDIPSLVLAVEVLSPGTARADRQVKRRLYQRHRVPEYWIVDVDARLIERWRPEDDRPELLSERVEWQPDPERAALVIELADYFTEVMGE